MATFTRLRSGDWGIRGTFSEFKVGDVLTVTNSSGRSSRIRVDSIVWSSRQQNVKLATIMTLPNEAAARRAAEPAGVDRRRGHIYPRPAVEVLASTPVNVVVRHRNGVSEADPNAADPTSPPEMKLPDVPLPPPTPVVAPTAEDVKRIADRSPCVIYTDVPEASGMPNPSAAFRRRGMVRVAWSDWAVPYDRIPWTLLNQYRERGCNMVPIRIDLRDAEAFLAKLRKQCRDEIEKRFVNMNKAIDGCEREGEPGHTTAERVRGKAATAEARICKLLEALEIASKTWGVTLYSARDVANRLKVVGNRAELKAKAYITGIAKLKKIDPVMAAAADRDDVEPGIMLDRLEDGGEDTVALRDAFRDE